MEAMLDLPKVQTVRNVMDRVDSSGGVVESICSDQLGKSPDNKPGGRKVDQVGDKKGLKKSKKRRKRENDNTYVGSVTSSPTTKRTTRQDTLFYRTRDHVASQPRECEACAEVFPNRTSLSDHTVCFIKH